MAVIFDWSAVGSSNLRFGINLTNPSGLAWDGTNLYMLDDAVHALYTVNTTTGIATRIGSPQGVTRPRGLAWDGSKLYAVAETLGNRPTSALFTVDRADGTSTRVGNANRFGVNERSPSGLAWDGTNLYMVGGTNDALFTVNTTTGVATRVGNANRFGVGESSPSGLAWDGTNLYMVGGTNDALYTVNTTTGVATRVGNADRFGVNERAPTGLAWDGTNLYMVGTTNDVLYTLDTTTGVATRIVEPPPELSNLGAVGDALYAVDRTNNALATVNTVTGIATRIGSATDFGVAGIFPDGLAGIGNTLYMVADLPDVPHPDEPNVVFPANALFTVNTTTGVATRVGNADRFGAVLSNPRALGALGNTLYMVASDGIGPNLYTVDTTTGVATRVGSSTNFGVGETRPRGLAAIGNTLYMVGDDNEGFYRLDTTTGAAVEPIGHDSDFGVGEDQPEGLASIGNTLYMWGAETDRLYKGDIRPIQIQHDFQAEASILQGELQIITNLSAAIQADPATLQGSIVTAPLSLNAAIPTDKATLAAGADTTSDTELFAFVTSDKATLAAHVVAGPVNVNASIETDPAAVSATIDVTSVDVSATILAANEAVDAGGLDLIYLPLELNASVQAGEAEFRGHVVTNPLDLNAQVTSGLQAVSARITTNPIDIEGTFNVNPAVVSGSVRVDSLDLTARVTSPKATLAGEIRAGSIDLRARIPAPAKSTLRGVLDVQAPESLKTESAGLRRSNLVAVTNKKTQRKAFVQVFTETDSTPGLVGTSVEIVYAARPDKTAPNANQVPLDSWNWRQAASQGDTAVTRSGWDWSSTFPDVSALNPWVFEGRRVYKGPEPEDGDYPARVGYDVEAGDGEFSAKPWVLQSPYKAVGADAAGFDYCYTATSLGLGIVGSQAPDPDWNFRDKRLVKGFARGKPAQTYYLGTPPTLSTGNPWLHRFRRPIIGAPKDDEDIGTVPWIQESPVEIWGREGPIGPMGPGWLHGDKDPTADDGADGDLWYNTKSGDTFAKADDAWAKIGNLHGDDGEAGSVWHHGNRNPAAGDGADGDYWLNTKSSDVFAKADDAWAKIGNIKGDDGDIGPIGPGWLYGSADPTADDGLDGDLWYNTKSGDTFAKADDAWAKVGNLKGKDGKDGTAGTVWTGTLVQFNALTTLDENTFYAITD